MIQTLQRRRHNLVVTLLFFGLFLLIAGTPEALAQEAANRQSPDAEDGGWVEKFYSEVDSLGATGYAVFAAAYVAATVLFLPGSVLTIGAGALFGVFIGTALVSVSSVAGAALAFLIARYVARDRIEKKFGQNKKFAAIDSAIGKEGGKIILLLRLTPLLPFNVSNYLYGLTAVRFWHYVLASWIGMFPGTVLYVYIGSLGKTVAEGADSGKLALNIVAFLATIAVTVYVTKVARGALKKADLATAEEEKVED